VLPNALLALFPAKGRREVLKLLFRDRYTGNASELARRARVTPRTALVVLDELRRAGLVESRGEGSALVFEPVEGELANAIGNLFRIAGEAPRPRDDSRLEAAAAHFGAPLLRSSPAPTQPLEEMLALSAKRSRQDPTLFRILPVLVLKNWTSIDWGRLRDCSLKADSKTEVGMLLDLTGLLSEVPELRSHSKAFRDERRSRLEYFFHRRSRADEELANARTPTVVRDWQFLMNMDLETMKSSLKTHG